MLYVSSFFHYLLCSFCIRISYNAGSFFFYKKKQIGTTKDFLTEGSKTRKIPRQVPEENLLECSIIE